MKIPNPLILLIATVLAFGALPHRQARADVSVSYFYDSLDPYGEWVDDPDYGYCWHPTNVDDNWAPYTDGYWAYTDGGWTWVSYEDYGGIVYHYGRWARIPGEGWVWVPGETWAPAWVSWRSNGDYIGWAPLPPEARWNAEFGFGRGVDARFDIGPGFYSFVGVRDFGAPALGAVILSRDRNVTIINNTTNITNITINNSNVYTGGPRFADLAGRTARPIPTLKLVRQTDAGAIRGGKILSRQQGNQLTVIAPRVSAPVGKVAPSKVSKTLTGVKADHGWSGVSDPDASAKLRAKYKAESGGNANAAAKPVDAADIKEVDQRIKSQPVKTDTGLATGAATPKAGKGKGGKTKMTDSALENAPATDETGAAAATPKPGKNGKGKKAITPADESTGGSADETPVPKKGKKSQTATQSSFLDATGGDTPAPKKSKKAKTPDQFDSDAPVTKRPKNSDLQPFNGGDTSEPKHPASYDAGGGPKYDSEPKYGQGTKGNADANGEPRPKSAKSGKGKKSDQQPSPNQFGQ